MSMANKWSIHKMLSGSKLVRSHMPTTRPFTYTSYDFLLKRYKQVFIKPVYGSCGAGVVRVSRIKRTYYQVQIYNKIVYFKSSRSAYRYVKKFLGSTRCIIQKGVSLGRIHGRPFDLRVMLQRTRRYKPWHVTGILAKVAGKNYVITNVRRSKGYVVPFSTIIHSSKNFLRKQRQIKNTIHRLSLAAVKQISYYHPRMRTIGLDIGLTAGGRVYLIEANSKPMITLFRMLKDRTAYRKMVALYKAKDNNS